MRDWLRLIRVAGLCTIASNIIAAVAVVMYGDSLDYGRLGLALWIHWPRALVVAGASCLLYAAGMLWNDVADAERDRELHPQRPLPAGRIGTGFAYLAALIASTGALLLAGLLGYRGFCAAGLVLGMSLLYDFGAKSVPWLGSLVMAMVRAGHAVFCLLLLGELYFDQLVLSLLAGVGLYRGSFVEIPLGYPLLLGLYIFAVTLISELESRHGRRLELLVAGALLAGVLLAAWIGALGASWVQQLHQEGRTVLLALAVLLLSVLAAWALWRLAKPWWVAVRQAKRALITPVLISGLGGILWFDALIAAAYHPQLAVVILLLIPAYKALALTMRMD